MLALNAAVLFLLAYTRPLSCVAAVGNSRHRVTKAATVALATGSLFACCAIVRQQTITSIDQKTLSYLLAEYAVGGRWPIGSRIDASLEPLESGRWMVLVVRRDCVHCRELLEKKFHDSELHRPDERTVIFIAGTGTWRYQFDNISLEGAAASFTWQNGEPFIASPAVFILREGQIVDASDGPGSEGMLDKLFNSLALPPQKVQ